MKRNLAWHFLADGNKMRDGRRAPKDGSWLEHKGPLVLCESGLHAGLEPFDAMQYAPGPILCLVEYGGKVEKDNDKVVCTRRKIIARMDATKLLRYFARMQALSVIHLNEDLCGNETVVDYLMTGDDSLRAAAWAATRDAARAAREAARVAWDAAWAARDAAWAARDAAWAAARDAAWAARTAWDAAWAAREAALAARDAAWAAAWDAARAARDAARAAAWDAARQHFNDLVYESFEAFL